MKSLVVDDEITTRMLLDRMLSEYGQCDTASNGKEAVEAFLLAVKEGKPYDLICLDIKMPESTGDEVLEEIRKIEENIGVSEQNKAKIIMATSVNDEEMVLNTVVNLGCNSYILKPITKNKVVKNLKELDLIQE